MSCLLVRYEYDSRDSRDLFFLFSLITYGKFIVLQWLTFDFCESTSIVVDLETAPPSHGALPWSRCHHCTYGTVGGVILPGLFHLGMLVSQAAVNLSSHL